MYRIALDKEEEEEDMRNFKEYYMSGSGERCTYFVEAIPNVVGDGHHAGTFTKHGFILSSNLPIPESEGYCFRLPRDREEFPRECDQRPGTTYEGCTNPDIVTIRAISVER